MRYAQAVTDERAKYRQEQKAICKGRITARSADGALMTPTQAFEDAQARYVGACAPIIAQAYHDGNYDGFWQALSNATSTSDFIYYKNAAFHIIEQTIILTGLLDHDISDGALHDTSFMRAVARDTIKNSDDHPNGVHRLFGRLYDWGDFNALKTSNPSFTAARNAVALGSRIMEELANTVTNDEELLNNALKLCAPTGLAEHAYLADADNSDLATLIDTFQEQKLMKAHTKKGNYCRTMHVGDNEVMYSTLAFPAINVDMLIDFAAARMAVS